MALVGAPFPYDIENLLAGGAAIYYAPIGTAIPTDISSVIDMVAPYAVATGWVPLGATKEAFKYDRSFTTSGLEIQETNVKVFEEITDIERKITVSTAEFNPFGFQLMENAPSSATVASAAGKSAQKKIAFGNFTSVTRYRFAFISRRPKGAGIVTEPTTGKTRGRLVMGTGYNVGMSAGSISLEQGKGSLTAAALEFTLFEESVVAQPEGQGVGFWSIEDAGTIT